MFPFTEFMMTLIKLFWLNVNWTVLDSVMISLLLAKTDEYSILPVRSGMRFFVRSRTILLSGPEGLFTDIVSVYEIVYTPGLLTEIKLLVVSGVTPLLGPTMSN